MSIFKGIWKAGKFEGRYTRGPIANRFRNYTPFVGQFYGSQFVGRFESGNSYRNYCSSPATFFEGEWANKPFVYGQSNDTGILGLQHLHALGQSNFEKVHLLQIAPDDRIYITDYDGHIIEIDVSWNSHVKKYEFESNKGIQLVTEMTRSVNIPWNEMRSRFEDFTVTKDFPFHILGFVHISKVKSLSTERPEVPNVHDLPFLGQTICFSNFPQLGIVNDICFDCFEYDDADILWKIHDSMYSGAFFTLLEATRDLVKMGWIDGYGKYAQLSRLFNGNEGDYLDYSKAEIKISFEFLLELNLLFTNARGKSNREILLLAFKRFLFLADEFPPTPRSECETDILVDFSKDDRIGIDLILVIKKASKSEQIEIGALKADVEGGQFYHEIMRIQRHLREGSLLGYHNRPELSSLFPKQGSAESPHNDRANNGLSYLCKVVRLLIDKTASREDAEMLRTLLRSIISDEF